MDLLTRWTIVLRLICGRSLREDGPAVTGVKNLTKARDALVHQRFRKEGPERALLDRWSSIKHSQVSEAFETLVLLCLEVDAVLEHHTDALPFNGEGIYNHSPRNLLVEDVIQRCHTIHQKNWKGHG